MAIGLVCFGHYLQGKWLKLFSLTADLQKSNQIIALHSSWLRIPHSLGLSPHPVYTNSAMVMTAMALAA